MKKINRTFGLAALFVIVSLLLTSITVLADTGLTDKKPTHTPRAFSTQKVHGNSDKKQTLQPDDAALTGTPDGKGNKPEDNGKPEDKSAKKENYRGTIETVDSASLVLTLEGGNLTFQLTDDTRIKIPTLKDATAINLPIGGTVFVQAVKGENDSLVAVSISLIPGKPQPLHRVGIVTDYQPGVSISIQDKKDGTVYTFLVSEQTKLLPADRAEQLAAGTLVTIISPRDVTGGAPAASGIVIHPASQGMGTQTGTALPELELTGSPTPTSTLTPTPEA